MRPRLTGARADFNLGWNESTATVVQNEQLQLCDKNGNGTKMERSFSSGRGGTAAFVAVAGWRSIDVPGGGVGTAEV